MKKKDSKSEEKAEKMACGGKVQKLAAGGSAKSRKNFPMTKPVPKKK